MKLGKILKVEELKNEILEIKLIDDNGELFEAKTRVSKFFYREGTFEVGNNIVFSTVTHYNKPRIDLAYKATIEVVEGVDLYKRNEGVSNATLRHNDYLINLYVYSKSGFLIKDRHGYELLRVEGKNTNEQAVRAFKEFFEMRLEQFGREAA